MITHKRDRTERRSRHAKTLLCVSLVLLLLVSIGSVFASVGWVWQATSKTPNFGVVIGSGRLRVVKLGDQAGATDASDGSTRIAATRVALASRDLVVPTPPESRSVELLPSYRPWPGVSGAWALTIPLWMFGVPLVIPLLISVRAHRRRENRVCCVACGFDLLGGAGVTCPECGEPVPTPSAGFSDSPLAPASPFEDTRTTPEGLHASENPDRRVISPGVTVIRRPGAARR